MVIPGFSAYDVDEHGTVTIVATGEVVPHNTKSLYRYVYIKPDKGQKRQVNVHVLVATAFLGPKPEQSSVIRFRDGNRDNVDAANLMWTTRQELSAEYAQDLSKTRKPRSSAAYHRACADRVYEALRDYGEPITMVELANIMQEPYSVVRYAMYGLIAVGKADAVRGGYIAL